MKHALQNLKKLANKENLKAKSAFTLAEVLIVIVVVGVVAAMTIPNLQKTYKAHQLRAQFNKSISTVQQALYSMEDNGELAGDLGKYYPADGFYKILAKYLKVSEICPPSYKVTTQNHCLKKFDTTRKNYKDYSGKTTYTQDSLDNGQLTLQDGTSLFFEQAYGDYKYNGRIWISIDLNGYMNPPNIAGYDLFTFDLDGNKLNANNGYCGAPSTYCNIKSTGYVNGMACACLAQSDTEYFKKAVREVKLK